MKTLLITNLVYGEQYAEIFCKFHVKSLLDETNLMRHHKRLSYLIFTDKETAAILEKSEYLLALSRVISVEINYIKWPKEAHDKFASRYGVQAQTLQTAIKKALQMDAYLYASVADSVFGKDFFDQVFMRLDQGHDAFFMNYLRTSIESIAFELDEYPNALPAYDLFDAAYANLHPLYLAAHVESPTFTKIPHVLVWNSGRGLMIRSFSLNPSAFVPNESMLEKLLSIDCELQAFCHNPYFAKNWIEAPMIGVEPTLHFWPPFTNSRINIKEIAQAEKLTHRRQNVMRKVFYPDETYCRFSSGDIIASDQLVKSICMN